MVIRKSVSSYVTYMIVCGAVMVWGFYLWRRQDTFGLLFILMGLSFVVLYVFRGVMDRSTRIIIDEEGITADEFPVSKIYWKDIKKAKLTRFSHLGRIITFELYDESKYTGHPPKSSYGRLMGFTTFSIMAEDLDVSPAKIYAEINSHIAAQSQDSSTE